MTDDTSHKRRWRFYRTAAGNERDDLDDFIAEIAKSDPDFPARVEAGVQERLAAIARGEDPNDISWDDEEEGTSAPEPATPQRQ